MIQITDRTLSCLDGYPLVPSLLREFLGLLLDAGVDRVELSPKVYRVLAPLDPRGRYVMRISRNGRGAEPEPPGGYPYFRDSTPVAVQQGAEVDPPGGYPYPGRLSSGRVSPVPDLPGWTDCGGWGISGDAMAYAGMVDVTRVSEVMPYNDPLVGSFVAKNAEEHTGIGLYPEIVLNDLQETKTIARFANCAKVRIRGMEDIMLGNYSVGFAWLRKTFSGQIEWSPTDGLGLAAATAVEWLMSGCGTEVVTSFEGIGGFAPFEEVVLALRSLRKRNIGKQFTMFPRMRELMEMITGRHCPPNKPVLGRSIFSVESGIHVDGIMKQPKCYEPFPPELVGQSRSFLLGKLSGKASVLVKMGQLGFSGGESEADELAARVKGESARKNRCLSDAEFAELYREICDGRVHQ